MNHSSQENARQLDHDKLEKFLAWLHEDQHTAACTLLEIRQRLEFLLTSWHCLDLQECLDETVDRVATQLSVGKDIRTQDRFAYLHGVARNVMRDQNRKRRKSFAPLESDKNVENMPDPTDRITEQELREIEKHRIFCLDKCLSELTDYKRTIAKFYFPGGGPDQARRRKRLARLLDISANALRIMASRVRQELAECIHSCLVEREAI
ncbi:hypothetical protein MJD09_17875 [bacterium]|nr:hypothetical protein [bacterium]